MVEEERVLIARSLSDVFVPTAVGRAFMSVCVRVHMLVGVRACARVCVCEGGACVCVFVCERERVCVCVCLCVKEIEMSVCLCR